MEAELRHFGFLQEALDLAHRDRDTHAARLEKIKAGYPRAYEPWSSAEDARLVAMVDAGKQVSDIATQEAAASPDGAKE